MKYKITPKQSLFIIGIAAITLFVVIVLVRAKALAPLSGERTESKILASYRANIVRETQENEYFRRVLFTGLNSQLVVMSIPPGGDVGEETHKYTEQTLFFLSGTGMGALNDKQFPIGPGDVVTVVPGTKHNFWNTGAGPLKIYTVYAPPNHIDGRVHKTKADADVDTIDEAFGESAPVRVK